MSSFSSFQQKNGHGSYQQSNFQMPTHNSRSYLESQLFQDSYVPDIMPYSEHDDEENDGENGQFPDQGFFNDSFGEFTYPAIDQNRPESFPKAHMAAPFPIANVPQMAPFYFPGQDMGKLSFEKVTDNKPSPFGGVPQIPMGSKNQPSIMPSFAPALSQSTASFIYMVAFKRHSKEYMLSGNRLSAPVTVGDAVIVATDRGEHLGIVTHIFPFDQYIQEKFQNSALPDFDITKFVGKILRIASTRECRLLEMKARDEEQVLRYARHIVANVYRLRLQIFDVEYQFDRFQITVFYDVVNRIDFRNFVRDLHSTFNARIWMEREKQAK